MTFFLIRRSIFTFGAAALLASCSNASSPITPIAPAAEAPASVERVASADVRSAVDPRVQSSHHGAFAAAARRAPFTLKDFHGAMGAYIEALQRGGYLGAAPHSKSWLDRAAFDRISREADAALATTPTPANSHHLLYGINNDEATVDIYQTSLSQPQHNNQPMIGQIALPTIGASVSVDLQENIYVGAGHAIYEYTRASIPNPIRTITFPHTPEGIAITSDGTLYAANFFPYLDGTPAVFVVAPGATVPTGSLSDPSINNGDRVATDNAGNIYLSYQEVPGNDLKFGIFPAGSTTFVPVGLTEYAADVALDPSGNLLVANVTPSETTTLDTIPSGSYTPKHSTLIETKFDYLTLDHTPDVGHLYLIENNVAEPTPDSPIYEYAVPNGVLVDTIGTSTQYYELATAPFAALPPAWKIPTGPAPSPTPTASPVPAPTSQPTAPPSGSPPTPPGTSCSNAADGPLLDPQSRKLTFGGSTICVGSGGFNGYNGVTTTATLYSALSGNVISKFSFAATPQFHDQRETIGCPFVGSYYVEVTSNVGALVQSSTVEATQNNGAPTC